MLINEASEGEGNNFLSHFLRFIKGSMLDPNKDSRASSKDVDAFLEECLKKHHDAGSYWSFDSAKCWADEDGAPPRCIGTSKKRSTVNFSDLAVGSSELPPKRRRVSWS